MASRKKNRRPPKPLLYVRPRGTIPDFTIHFDGGCWPNPGGDPKWGVVVYDRTGNLIHTLKGSAEDKYPKTNNTAEFSGMLMAVNVIVNLRMNDAVVLICGDSRLAIDAMQKSWPMKKSPHLSELATRCRIAIIGLGHRHPYFEWVPREENSTADQLTSED